MAKLVRKRLLHARFTKTRLAQSISSALLIPVVSTSVLAQPVLEEIVVTATKRAESIMDVPLAISVVSGDFAREANLNDIKDVVKLSPGVTGNSQDSFLDAITIRGIRTNDFGNGGDPAIGVYKNGNYQGRNGVAVSSLFDIDRVEVLRGPQAFLFGRGAISGAINTHTAKASPDQQSGYIELDAGERGVLVGEGAFNIPLGDETAMRIALYHSEEDGWARNLADGEDYFAHEKDAVRVSFNHTSDKLEANLVMEYEDRQQDGTVYRALDFSEALPRLTAAAAANGNFAAPASAGNNPQDFNADLGAGDEGIFDRGEVLGLGLQLDYQLDGMVLTSITGYRDHEYGYAEDYDGTSVELFYYAQDQEGDYLEQEFRLTSDTEDALSWYAGASYYQEDIDTVFTSQQAEEVYCGIYFGAACSYVGAYYGFAFEPSADGQINDLNRIVGDYEGYAAYIDLAYDFNESFDIGFGVRYTYDEKTFSQQTLPNDSFFAGGVGAPQTGGLVVSDTQDWDAITWRLVGNYHFDGHLVFASVSTGSKSGGFDSFRLDVNGVPNSFDKEESISYELGYKGTIWDGRTQITANLFYYEYEDLQIVFTAPGEPLSQVGNIGEVEGLGFEGTANTALSDHFTLQVGVSWLDTEVSGYQPICDPIGTDACEGQALSGVPEWTFFGALRAGFPVENGEWIGSLIYSQEGETYSNINRALAARNEGFKDAQLSVGFQSKDNWSLKLYVENLTDEDGYDGIVAGNTAAGTSNYPELGLNPFRPRTIGARFGYEF
ncbi:MAG: TonB-dependent receptor [Pseudomonadales bacterium]